MFTESFRILEFWTFWTWKALFNYTLVTGSVHYTPTLNYAHNPQESVLHIIFHSCFLIWTLGKLHCTPCSMTARSEHLQIWFYKETLIINIGILEGPINDVSFPCLTSEGVRQMEVTKLAWKYMAYVWQKQTSQSQTLKLDRFTQLQSILKIHGVGRWVGDGLEG